MESKPSTTEREQAALKCILICGQNHNTKAAENTLKICGADRHLEPNKKQKSRERTNEFEPKQPKVACRFLPSDASRDRRGFMGDQIGRWRGCWNRKLNNLL